MSDEKRNAFIDCGLTNNDSTVLVDVNGNVILEADPYDYNVLGFYHSGGAGDCDDWMEWNADLVEKLTATVINTLDLDDAPEESSDSEYSSPRDDDDVPPFDDEPISVTQVVLPDDDEEAAALIVEATDGVVSLEEARESLGLPPDDEDGDLEI